MRHLLCLPLISKLECNARRSIPISAYSQHPHLESRLACERMGPSARAPGAMKGAKKGMASSTSLLLKDMSTLPARCTGYCVEMSRWMRLPMEWPSPNTGRLASLATTRMHRSSLKYTSSAILRWLKPVAKGAATICEQERCSALKCVGALFGSIWSTCLILRINYKLQSLGLSC